MRLLQNSFYLLILLVSASANSQFIPEFQPKPEKTVTYISFGLSIPLRHHFDGNAEVDDMRFMPDGINTKFGAGFHHDRWLAVGLHTGAEWRLSEKLVSIPMYLNVRLAPEINEITRLVIQPGFGYVLAIGHGDLSGYYGKISIGLEGLAGVMYFAEYSQLGFSRDDTGHIRALSLGIGLTIF